MRVKGLQRKFLNKLIVDSVFSSVSLLVELSSEIKGSLLDLINFKHTYKYIRGSWLIVIVVLVNAYKSLLTTSILAPAPPKQAYSHIHELGDFYIVSPELRYYIWVGTSIFCLQKRVIWICTDVVRWGYFQDEIKERRTCLQIVKSLLPP